MTVMCPNLTARWRQLSEPSEAVLWVDRLTQKEFEEGFGSHTPIYSGQSKILRYYMNFDRAFGLFKEVLLKVCACLPPGPNATSSRGSKRIHLFAYR